MVEEKEEKKPEGFYLTEVPASYAKVIALDGKEVNADELLVKMANALKDSGIMKDY